jgi:hypothetical protein
MLIKNMQVVYSVEWTIDQNGRATSHDGGGAVYGRWRLDRMKKHVLFSWNKNNQWDSFKLPIEPSATVGESWTGADLLLAQKIKEDPAAPK